MRHIIISYIAYGVAARSVLHAPRSFLLRRSIYYCRTPYVIIPRVRSFSAAAAAAAATAVIHCFVAEQSIRRR